VDRLTLGLDDLGKQQLILGDVEEEPDALPAGDNLREVHARENVLQYEVFDALRPEAVDPK
jgi:hypothetical protein